MKAIVYSNYGPPEVLRLAEVDKPLPRANEILIRIHATTVTAEDPKLRGFTFPPLLRIPIGILFGFKKPRVKILGSELAGVVEATGKEVTKYHVGDQVYGYTGLRFGAYAQYQCVPEDGVMAIKPDNMSYEEAAAIPNGALTAFVYLCKKAKLRRGDDILIYGASGSVGTAAVQLAKYIGAKVTGVCSTRKVERVKALGADKVIDYTKEDFVRCGGIYDVIFDTVGKTSLTQIKHLLKENGRYLVTDFGMREILQMLWTSMLNGKKVIAASSNFSWKSEDLLFFNKRIEAGEFKAVIDRRYPLEQIADAHRYVEQGHKTGNVVITVTQ